MRRFHVNLKRFPAVPALDENKGAVRIQITAGNIGVIGAFRAGRSGAGLQEFCGFRAVRRLDLEDGDNLDLRHGFILVRAVAPLHAGCARHCDPECRSGQAPAVGRGVACFPCVRVIGARSSLHICQGQDRIGEKMAKTGRVVAE